MNDQPTRRRMFRLVSRSGARVVRPDRLSPTDRAKAMLPSVFTLANMLCGFSSLRAAQHGELRLAAALIGAAVVFDIADGASARAVGATTPFGLQFDSLADLISFGVAPAMLLYSWALTDLGLIGWALACFWLACAAYRLGRFNVTVDPMSDKRYFVGLPSPGAAAVVLSSVFAAADGFDDGSAVIPVLITVVPAVLMASSFRFMSFRTLASPRRDRIWVSALLVAALVVGFVTRPALTGMFAAYTYVAMAPLGWLTAPLRRRWWPDSVAPPRHYFPSVFFLTPPPAASEAVAVGDDLVVMDDDLGDDPDRSVGP